MKIDLYTKVVLTVIAISLVGILIQGSVRPSFAQGQGLIKVTICDPEGGPAQLLDATGGLH